MVLDDLLEKEQSAENRIALSSPTLHMAADGSQDQPVPMILDQLVMYRSAGMLTAKVGQGDNWLYQVVLGYLLDKNLPLACGFGLFRCQNVCLTWVHLDGLDHFSFN